jgi:hypothetical protein
MESIDIVAVFQRGVHEITQAGITQIHYLDKMWINQNNIRKVLNDEITF